jgi:hypothetical protein
MRRIIFFFFLFIAAKAGAQSWDKPTVEKLLCREWQIVKMIENGEIMSPEEAEIKETITFRADHTLINNQEDGTSTWAYDADLKGIWVTLPDNEEQMLMGIREITSDKLILEMSDEEETMELHLRAVKK